MDLLVLLPLEFLTNFPSSKPALEVLKGKDVGKKRVPAKSGGVQLEEEDVTGELDVKAKLRIEFAKIPALLTFKPN